MKDYDEELFLRYTTEFNAIRVIDKSIMSTKWKIKTDLFVSEDIEDYQFNLTLIKLKYFFEQILTDSIILSAKNEWAMRSFATGDVENHLIILPDDPVDDIIAHILQSKMNALGDDSVLFGAIDIESDNANGVGFIFAGSGEHNLPDIKEWIGDRSYFEKPWWARNDASTMDIIPAPDANLEEKPAFAYSLDFLKDAIKGVPATTAKIIKPEFKPVVIQGKKV